MYVYIFHVKLRHADIILWSYSTSHIYLYTALIFILSWHGCFILDLFLCMYMCYLSMCVLFCDGLAWKNSLTEGSSLCNLFEMREMKK